MPLENFARILACPVCKSALRLESDQARCLGSDCRRSFPVQGGKPVLICEERSVFSIQNFLAEKNIFSKPAWKKRLACWAPTLSHNLMAKRNYARLAALLVSERPNRNPFCLIIGCGEAGSGIELLEQDASITVIHSDVNFNSVTDVIADGHDLPFLAESIDAVVIQAVLEHVVDPPRVVGEICRVLKPDGLVYAESPFLQQVHMEQHDFTRWTCLGQRRLFREFELIEMGACCGAGMALGWAWRQFLMSFFRNRLLLKSAANFARLTGFWLKYFDYLTLNAPAAIDGAAGTYFLGRKSARTCSDAEILAQFNGVRWNAAARTGDDPIPRRSGADE